MADRHSNAGDVIYRSEDGIPLIWISVFGERNVWNVGDDVSARGGAVGARNVWETNVETALVRLDHAADTLKACPHVWPWMSPMLMLRRKLSIRSKEGFIRLCAPWTENLEEEDAETWKSAPAFLENFVNFISAGRRTEAAVSIRRLQPFCLFTPEGHGADREEFKANRHYRNETEKAVRSAFLMLGEPGEKLDMFRKAALNTVGPPMEEYAKLPPLPEPGSSLVKTIDLEEDAPNGGSGFLGKLTGYFWKRN